MDMWFAFCWCCGITGQELKGTHSGQYGCDSSLGTPVDMEKLSKKNPHHSDWSLPIGGWNGGISSIRTEYYSQK